MATYQLPSVYHESGFTQPPQLKDDLKLQKLNRKPVPSQKSSHTSKSQKEIPVNIGASAREDVKEVAPLLPPHPGLSLETSLSETYNNTTPLYAPARTDTSTSEASASTLYEYGSPSTNSFLSTLSATCTGTAESLSPQSSSSSGIKKAYEEARHFAGGLIQRSCESTNHFTILRHSHGLVYYQGASTSIAVSTFSDEPLPPDRTLWLQSKGWTGKTGMRAKALMGRNENWLNVTPTLAIGTEQVNPMDERAWQRDLRNFQKKAPSKIRDRHHLRETAVVRIPAEAGDGYFQLVLCTVDKKKVLCTSPAFRVLSASTSPSSIRGASLSTLPFELGAMALTTYGKSTVGAAVSVATSPFQSQVHQYMPSFWTRKAAFAAYEVSGAQKRIDSTAGDAQSRYEQALGESFAVTEKEEVALEEGPTGPYPISFVAENETGTSRIDQLNLPIINISVPGNVWLRLYGYYFGWVRHLLKQQKGKKSMPAETSWIQAIISSTLIDSSQLARINVSCTTKKQFALHIIQEPEDESFFRSDCYEVRVMGFIRPDEPAQRANLEGLQAGHEPAAEASMLAEVNDISMAQEILDHPSWDPDKTEREIAQEGKMGRMEKLKKGYTDTRMAAQKQIDRVPFHKAGIRLPVEMMEDRNVMTGGFYVIR